MSLTLQQVEHISKLARLQLTEAEKELFTRQLSAILDYFQELEALDTGGIPPTSSVLPPQTVLRADEIYPSLTREQLLKNAPETGEGQFKVPPVLE